MTIGALSFSRAGTGSILACSMYQGRVVFNNSAGILQEETCDHWPTCHEWQCSQYLGGSWSLKMTTFVWKLAKETELTRGTSTSISCDLLGGLNPKKNKKTCIVHRLVVSVWQHRWSLWPKLQIAAEEGKVAKQAHLSWALLRLYAPHCEWSFRLFISLWRKTPCGKDYHLLKITECSCL